MSKMKLFFFRILQKLLQRKLEKGKIKAISLRVYISLLNKKTLLNNALFSVYYNPLLKQYDLKK